jgi:hypothetical protein
VLTATGLAELSRLCVEYPGKRLDLLKLACCDAYLCASQVL